MHRMPDMRQHTHSDTHTAPQFKGLCVRQTSCCISSGTVNATRQLPACTSLVERLFFAKQEERQLCSEQGTASMPACLKCGRTPVTGQFTQCRRSVPHGKGKVHSTCVRVNTIRRTKNEPRARTRARREKSKGNSPMPVLIPRSAA